MKTYVHLWSHLAQSFLEWEMFQTKVVQKIKKTQILCSVNFSENRAFFDVRWEKYFKSPSTALSSVAECLSCFTEDNNAKEDKVLHPSPVPKPRQRYNHTTGGKQQSYDEIRAFPVETQHLKRRLNKGTKDENDFKNHLVTFGLSC